MSTSDECSYYHQAACKLDPNSHPVTAFFHVFWCQLSQVRFPPEANLRHVNMQGVYYGLLLKPTLTKIEKGSRIGQRENLSCDPILSHPTGSSEAGTTLQSCPPVGTRNGVSTRTRISQPLEGEMTLGEAFFFIIIISSQQKLMRAALPVALPATGRCGGHFWRKTCAVDTTAPTTEEMVKSGNIKKLQSPIDNDICWLLTRKEVLKQKMR